ncbi:MAG: acyl-CoA dehydrogenase family protein [Candidatus Competibacteraceae bacterium]|nr:acyl-CoA dehydrogenase family protein [Candidatus Competibacteraceae bacterium]
MMIALTDIQKEVQKTFQEFTDKHVKPVASKIDEEKQFPHTLFKQVGDLGFFGMRYPQSEGGEGLDVVSYILAVMELSRGSMSLAAACTMQSLMGTYFLYRFGNTEIKEHYFLEALKGNKIGGICMTEPDAGSDLMSIKTTATVTADGFILNGQKTWITSAPVANFFTVFARTNNHDQLSIFFVPATAQGVMIGKNIEKMGVRASLTSEVAFDNVHLPPHYLLGEIGSGTKCLREILAEIRIMTGALAIGIATAAYQDALEYANTRIQFGKPVGKFQAIQLKFADMAVKLETAKSYVLYAASLSDSNQPRQKESMIAKLYASECAASICDEASRVLASYGYATEYNMERYLRDVRFTLIGGGTSEILKINIAKEMGL